jgi:hypothetical protein
VKGGGFLRLDVARRQEKGLALGENEGKKQNKLREAIRDRQVQGTDISPDTLGARGVRPVASRVPRSGDLGNRSGTSLDTYTNR